jgi:antitoxin HicB
MTVGGNRAEALERIHDALLVMLAGRMEDHEPVPRPSRPARGQRTILLSPMVAAKLSVYEAMRVRRWTPDRLRQHLGWEERRLRRLLDLRRPSRLDDIEAALKVLGKRLVIGVQNAA